MGFRDLFPRQFVEKLERFFPDEVDQILSGLTKDKTTTFRINHLKITRREFVVEAVKRGIKFNQVQWYEDAFVLIAPSQREFQNTSFYQEGQVYLQNLSSMIPPLLMDLEPGQRVLDLCAAPGSKTTQLFSLTRGKIELVAVEKIKVRYYKLLANLSLQGCEGVKVLLSDGTRIGSRYQDYFDRVLVDAPCSAEGRFDPNDPRSFKYWSPRKVKEMVRKQRGLLKSAVRALRPGGVLVYSTCTFSPEENEFLIEWLLEKFPEVSLVEFTLPIKNTFRGINRIGWHILPSSTFEGFYVVKLKKTTPSFS